MKKWEYRTVNGMEDDFQTDLNSLGSDGWELTFTSILPGTSPVQWVGIVKRERPDSATGLEFPFSEAVHNDPDSL